MERNIPISLLQFSLTRTIGIFQLKWRCSEWNVDIYHGSKGIAIIIWFILVYYQCYYLNTPYFSVNVLYYKILTCHKLCNIILQYNFIYMYCMLWTISYTSLCCTCRLEHYHEDDRNDSTTSHPCILRHFRHFKTFWDNKFWDI